MRIEGEWRGGSVEVFGWRANERQHDEPGIVWLIVEENPKRPGAKAEIATIPLLIHEAQNLSDAINEAANRAAQDLENDEDRP